MKWPTPRIWERIPRSETHRQKGLQKVKDPVKAAMIPLNFSLALAEACETGIGQATLQEAER